MIRGSQLGKKAIDALTPNPEANIFNDLLWNTILAASQVIPELRELPNHIKSNLKMWQSFMKNENPFTCDLPLGFEDLSSINRLIMVKAFKPEKIMHSFSLFV